MREIFRKWIDRYFSDEEALVLFLLLTGALVVILTMGQTLTPVFAGIILAFLMQGAVDWLVQRKLPHTVAVTLVFVGFVSSVTVFLLLVMPQVWQQLINLFNELPGMAAQLQSTLVLLPEQYPGLIAEEQITEIISMATSEVSRAGQWVLTFSLNSITGLVALMIYLVLVPILVFFFLKDGRSLTRWWTKFLPERRDMMTKIWVEMDGQIANYIRGKVIEIIIVGVVSYLCFAIFGLNYAALLAIMVGLSVLVPYIGAALVTLPVALIGFIQWGWTSEFMYLMIAYGIIQALDGNVLVPLLFSEAVNLHPVAIIIAVLVFGGLWGFWGVFFAIPLATLLKAILNAWPNARDLGAEDERALPKAAD